MNETQAPKIINPKDYADIDITQYLPTVVATHDAAKGHELAAAKAEMNRSINRFVRALASENKDETLQTWAKTTTTIEKLSTLMEFVQNASRYGFKPDLLEFGARFLLENISKRL